MKTMSHEQGVLEPVLGLAYYIPGTNQAACQQKLICQTDGQCAASVTTVL